MSDYTPTTEEVRNIFSWNNDEAEVDAIIGFDRWLESIMQKAHIAERERIIKLLEDLVGVYDQHPVTADFGIKVCLSVIRGENK